VDLALVSLLYFSKEGVNCFCVWCEVLQHIAFSTHSCVLTFKEEEKVFRTLLAFLAGEWCSCDQVEDVEEPAASELGSV
jgi:hypothetical protein